jgi:hypothetical protein
VQEVVPSDVANKPPVETPTQPIEIPPPTKSRSKKKC